MSLSLAGAMGAPIEYKVGSNAGWLLVFYQEDASGKLSDKSVLELSRRYYYAEIQASLPGSLEGGNYSFVIEGLSNDDYAKISLPKNSDLNLVVKLYLFWRDGKSPVLDALTSALDLPDLLGNGEEKDHKDDIVAVLRVTSITRKVGVRRYDTTINARERIYDLAATRRPCGDSIDATDVQSALNELMKRTANLKDGNFQFYDPKDGAAVSAPSPSASASSTAQSRAIDTSQTALNLLAELNTRMENENKLHGRSMMLIRDGVLHAGKRPIPFRPVGKSPDPTLLTVSSGLFEVEALAPVVSDPNWEFCANPSQKPPQRKQFKLTAKGRPDIKPGDVVKFDPPKEDVSKENSDPLSFLGGLGDLAFSFVPGKMDNPVLLYVHSVDHRLGRATGFVTTIVGVEVSATEPDSWDRHTEGLPPSPSQQTTAANPESQIGKAMVQALHNYLEKHYQFPEVGEVRDFAPDNQKQESPSQTSRVWQGLREQAGDAFQARKTGILRPTKMEQPTTPYATPFAWGKCGQVLPRYPGMRVMLTHRRGRRDDPVDIGALWQDGHTPEAKPGDWWLILPADSPSGNAPDATSTDAPQDYSGKVSNDLIEQDGTRTIEVGTLSIRIGGLNGAGTRPARNSADDQTVTIEHVDGGAKIVIDQNGTITLTGKSISLKSDGDISMEAQGSVKVKCSTMDVS